MQVYRVPNECIFEKTKIKSSVLLISREFWSEINTDRFSSVSFAIYQETKILNIDKQKI